MRFGWQGFTLEHPDDWAPVALHGEFGSGYARLESSGSVALQVRWLKGDKPPDQALEAYLSKLARDSRRTGFSKEIERLNDGRVEYRYRGAIEGVGVGFAEAGRTFFLEITGSGKRPLGRLREIAASFGACVERPLWSLFGLDVRLPSFVPLRDRKLQSGRTMLRFAKRGVDIQVERWAMAEGLLATHSLESWALASMELGRATVSEAPHGMELAWKGLRPGFGLVYHRVERDQLVWVRAFTRKEEWRPKWDWVFAEIPNQ